MRRIASSPRGVARRAVPSRGQHVPLDRRPARRAGAGRAAPRLLLRVAHRWISARCSSIRSASPLARRGDLRLFGVATVVALASGNRDIGNRLGAIVGINLVLTFAVPVLDRWSRRRSARRCRARRGLRAAGRAKRPEWSIAARMLLVAFLAAGALCWVAVARPALLEGPDHRTHIQPEGC